MINKSTSSSLFVFSALMLALSIGSMIGGADLYQVRAFNIAGFVVWVIAEIINRIENRRSVLGKLPVVKFDHTTCRRCGSATWSACNTEQAGNGTEAVIACNDCPGRPTVGPQ